MPMLSVPLQLIRFSFLSYFIVMKIRIQIRSLTRYPPCIIVPIESDHVPISENEFQWFLLFTQ